MSMRPMRFLPLIVLAFALPWSGSAQADAVSAPAASQPADGRVLAQSICGACHVVARGGEAPILSPPGPNLVDVARRSSFSESFLRRFLASGHGRNPPTGAAPHPPLGDDQTSAVVAYIMSLKAAR